jgi:hypothetical protein
MLLSPRHFVGFLDGRYGNVQRIRLLNEMRKGAPRGRPATITSPLLAEALDSG